MASSFQTLYSVYGVSAAYTPPNGTATTGITVRLRRDQGLILVMRTSLEKPVKGGRFTIESSTEVWGIDEAPVETNGQWECKVKRVAAEPVQSLRGKDNA